MIKKILIIVPIVLFLYLSLFYFLDSRPPPELEQSLADEQLRERLLATGQINLAEFFPADWDTVCVLDEGQTIRDNFWLFHSEIGRVELEMRNEKIQWDQWAFVFLSERKAINLVKISKYDLDMPLPVRCVPREEARFMIGTIRKPRERPPYPKYGPVLELKE